MAVVLETGTGGALAKGMNATTNKENTMTNVTYKNDHVIERMTEEGQREWYVCTDEDGSALWSQNDTDAGWFPQEEAEKVADEVGGEPTFFEI
jgi:methanogenic corrinoid protein MtbC1